MREKTEAFLRAHHMHYSEFDFTRECTEFIQHMQNGLAGKPSSLMMIPTYIAVQDCVPPDEEVLIIDAGGTNLRVATVMLRSDSSKEITSFQRFPIPGTDKEITVDEFFRAIATYLLPVIDRAEKIGFCFSFPCEIMPDKDGRIIGFNKEVRVSNAAGVWIGKSLNAALKELEIAPRRVVVVNDTVATMLGGIAVSKSGTYDNYIGYILGTGTNTCYLEQCSLISKSAAAQGFPGHMGINLESGGYDGFRQGTFDRELDESSANLGDHKLEKMISGAYQGNVIYRTIAGAAQEGLLSADTAKQLCQIEDLSMKDIGQFCDEPNGDNVLVGLVGDNADDRQVISTIVDASLERAALITTVTFASIMLQSHSGKVQSKPVCISAEGTTFAKSVVFRQKLDACMNYYLKGQLGLHASIITGENTVTVGTAIAAWMNG